jgi:GNAT superfamily N-acetyltransferase
LSQNFYIAAPDVAAEYFDELHQRFKNEWPEIQPSGKEAPRPVVALTSTGALAGGLAFANARAPISEESAIWVNAVLVTPEYRRQGLGSQLIRAAEASAVQLGVSRLYALTELPILYSKLNWSILSSQGVDFIMSRKLSTSGF